MRKLIAVIAVLAASCASSHTESCLTLDGTYKLRGACSHKGSGASAFFFPNGASLLNLEAVTISQPGCTLKLHVTGTDGGAHDLILDDNLEWTQDGVSVSWLVHSGGPVILPGIASQSRTLRFQLSDDMLTVSSEFDERGVALLFIPFHDHGQAVCVMKRVKS